MRRSRVTMASSKPERSESTNYANRGRQSQAAQRSTQSRGEAMRGRTSARATTSGFGARTRKRASN
jgi:hypothetical protein